MNKERLREMEEKYLIASGWKPTLSNGHRRWYRSEGTLFPKRFDEALDLQLTEDRVDITEAVAPEVFAELELMYARKEKP